MNRLSLSADRLRLFDGPTPFVHRGTLDWLGYDVLLNEGERAYKTLVADRRSCGANTVCTSLRLSWGRNLHAANPGFWPNLIPAARIAADEGMRLCLLVLCDTAMDLGDGLHQAASWQPHIDRLLTHLGAEPNVSFVYVNQPGHKTQSRDLTGDVIRAFTKPHGFDPLIARDNPMESGNPLLPAGELALYCCDRNIQKYFNIGASLAQIVRGWPDKMAEWGGAHTASLLFEGWHAKAGDPSCDPGLARQVGRSLCFEGCVGGNAYVDQMAKGQLVLTGLERNYAVEFLGNIPGV